MVRKTLFGIVLLMITISMNPVMARVTGLPDFTGLVEQAGPAVVNIQVTKFGERARSVPQEGDEQFQQESIDLRLTCPWVYEQVYVLGHKHERQELCLE